MNFDKYPLTFQARLSGRTSPPVPEILFRPRCRKQRRYSRCEMLPLPSASTSSEPQISRGSLLNFILHQPITSNLWIFMKLFLQEDSFEYQTQQKIGVTSLQEITHENVHLDSSLLGLVVCFKPPNWLHIHECTVNTLVKHATVGPTSDRKVYWVYCRVQNLLRWRNERSRENPANKNILVLLF